MNIVRKRVLMGLSDMILSC